MPHLPFLVMRGGRDCLHRQNLLLQNRGSTHLVESCGDRIGLRHVIRNPGTDKVLRLVGAQGHKGDTGATGPAGLRTSRNRRRRGILQAKQCFNADRTRLLGGQSRALGRTHVNVWMNFGSIVTAIQVSQLPADSGSTFAKRIRLGAVIA